MIQQTTALRKIAGLRKRIWGIQGGQGAGKTFSILILIINYASANPEKEIYIVSAELSKMRDTVLKDFIKIIALTGLSVSFSGVLHGSPRCDFPNKSFVRFIGLDKEDVGKGLRSDLVYANELNKIPFSHYREITSRAKRVIVDFNPNKRFYFHNEIATRNDCDFLNLTFLDNELLSKEERSEILRYKEKGYDQSGNVINQYWANMWRVYGLGEIGQVEGRIYNWNPIAYSDYLKINKTAYYGVDWGKVDPFAIVEGKYSDGNLYLHEVNYKSENQLEQELSGPQLQAIRGGQTDDSDNLVTWLFTKLSVPKNAVITCDNNRPNKIVSLRRSGWAYAKPVGGKMDLINRISVLSGLNIYYTDSSKNIEMEQENYAYEKDRNGVLLETPIDQDNHLIDASVYSVQTMFNLGVIKNV